MAEPHLVELSCVPGCAGKQLCKGSSFVMFSADYVRDVEVITAVLPAV